MAQKAIYDQAFFKDFANFLLKNDDAFMKSLIHWAVIHNEYEALFPLKNDYEKADEQGWTPFELANFLGRRKCQEIIGNRPLKSFLVKKEPESPLETLSLEEWERFFSIEYLPSLLFSGYDAFLDTLKLCPYILRWMGKEMQKEALYYKNELLNSHVTSVSIRYINECMGFGLFAEENIPKGSWIGEYTGLVRPLYRHHQDHNTFCLHYPTRFWSWDFRIVDASMGGNELRFINHSECPNLTPRYLLDRQLLHFTLFTNRLIQKGEELTFDYGKDFWVNKSQE